MPFARCRFGGTRLAIRRRVVAVMVMRSTRARAGLDLYIALWMPVEYQLLISINSSINSASSSIHKTSSPTNKNPPTTAFKMNASPRVMAQLLKSAKNMLPKEAHPFFIFPKTVKAEPVHLPFYLSRAANTATA